MARVLKDRTMSVSEFKAKSLAEFEEVRRSRRSVTVTKRGKAVARVVPLDEESPGWTLGTLRDVVTHAGDVESPLGAAMWSVTGADDV